MQKALAQVHPLSVILCHTHYEILVRKVSVFTHMPTNHVPLTLLNWRLTMGNFPWQREHWPHQHIRRKGPWALYRLDKLGLLPFSATVLSMASPSSAVEGEGEERSFYKAVITCQAGYM